MANAAWNGAAQTSFLYHNSGDGTFSRITNGALVTITRDCSSGGWADYDNDGLLDLFAANYGANNDLWHNEGGGSFHQIVTAARGTIANDRGNSSCAAWSDYDRDGLVDLFVANWGGESDFLYRNDGDGAFTKMTTNEVGSIVGDRASTAQGAWADYDNDGWPDLFVPVNNGTAGPFGVRSLLYHNTADGAFESVTNNPVLEGAGRCWGAAWGDYDNDGLPDLFVSNWNGSFVGTNYLYHNLGGGVFERVLDSPVVAEQGWWTSCNWGDYDNDGYLDLFVAAVGDNALYHNEGNGTFTRVTTGSPVHDGGVSIGCVWLDYDNDGFLDLFVCNDWESIGSWAGPRHNFLYRNGGNANHWITFRLVGTASCRDAIGAKVRVQANIRGATVWQTRELSCGEAYSGNQLLAHFGLGDATNVDLVRIEWPSGNVQELTDYAVDQLYTITEPKAITPARPSASLNGSVTLTRAPVGGATYQWQFSGVDLLDQTNRTLTLASLTPEQEGHYGVVVSNATSLVTNYVYLHVDKTFSKITEGAVVNDPGYSYIPSWGDYDGDGWLDLFVGNGGNEGPTVPFLYHNNRDGTFTRMAADDVGELADDRVQVCEGSWADYDEDGDLDLFIGSAKQGDPNRLYENEGNGRFRRVVGDVGINQAHSPWGSAWADYDNDGSVDLYLGCGWSSLGMRDMVWRNMGDGTFCKCQSIPFRLMDVTFGTWGDADNDGDLELLVANFGSGNNAFYRNQGDGTFVEDPSAGLGPGGGGAVIPVWADFNNDGYLDVFLARNNTPCCYYQNNKDGTFQRITAGPHAQTMGLGASAGDYDNDGDLDLFLTRGQGSGEPCLLFRNEGDGTFVSVTCGSLTQDRGHWTSCAWADHDNDGALDLVVTTVANENNALFHNNGNANAWLLVQLVGTQSNRDAIGAKVGATALIGGRPTHQMRQIGGGSLGDPRAHFGLGNATRVSTLRVEWPSGAVEEFTNVAVNQILALVEPSLRGEFGADGMFYLQIRGDPNRTYEVQASADLTTWESVLYVVGPGADQAAEIAEPVSEQAQRFYRMVVVQ